MRRWQSGLRASHCTTHCNMCGLRASHCSFASGLRASQFTTIATYETRRPLCQRLISRIVQVRTNVSQCAGVCCNVLYSIAVCCSALTHCNTYCVICCSVLQCVAVRHAALATLLLHTCRKRTQSTERTNYKISISIKYTILHTIHLSRMMSCMYNCVCNKNLYLKCRWTSDCTDDLQLLYDA